MMIEYLENLSEEQWQIWLEMIYQDRSLVPEKPLLVRVNNACIRPVVLCVKTGAMSWANDSDNVIRVSKPVYTKSGKERKRREVPPYRLLIEISADEPDDQRFIERCKEAGFKSVDISNLLNIDGAIISKILNGKMQYKLRR